jgi:hypothetical protein
MAKRHPDSATITTQSGPDRRSLLMGTVATAAVPVIARGARAETPPAAPSANIAKPVDITLNVNDREHSVAHCRVQMSGRSGIS